MNKKISVVMILTVSFIIMLGVTSVAAKPARKITGSFQWDWPGFHGWGTLNVHETTSGEAEGWIKFLEKKVVDGEEITIYWEANVFCVDFYEYEGNPAAAFVIQADRVRGDEWWDGDVGQYWTVFVVDGGTPGRAGDLIGATWDLVNWPSFNHPGCDFDDEPDWFIPSAGGNIVIHD